MMVHIGVTNKVGHDVFIDRFANCLIYIHRSVICWFQKVTETNLKKMYLYINYLALIEFKLGSNITLKLQVC